MIENPALGAGHLKSRCATIHISTSLATAPCTVSDLRLPFFSPVPKTEVGW